MSASPIEFRPISEIFGVEAVGVDLREELDETTIERLRQAWHRHALLLFRDQELSEEQLDRTASMFGVISYEGEYPNYVSNVDPKGLVPTGELKFHMDFSWSPDPLRGLMLYGYEVPPPGAGGDTLFANVQLAYELLPPELRRRVEKLRIVHSTNAVPGGSYGSYVSTSVHPVAFQHPVTDETVLFCSPRHFQSFEGLDAGETARLLAELSAYIQRPEVVYRHVWHPHDLLVWDNIKLQHARTDFDPKYRRHLRRTQIAAKAAVPA